LDGLKKLEQRIHKYAVVWEEYVDLTKFFNPAACCSLYKAKDLSAPFVYSFSNSKDTLNKEKEYKHEM
jgi:hypothetical protein